MRTFISRGGSKQELPEMNAVQTRQAIEIMDRIASFIPHEGVDYEAEIMFSEENRDSVQLNITAHTEKGAFWRDYVSRMIKKEKWGHEKVLP